MSDSNVEKVKSAIADIASARSRLASVWDSMNSAGKSSENLAEGMGWMNGGSSESAFVSEAIGSLSSAIESLNEIPGIEERQ